MTRWEQSVFPANTTQSPRVGLEPRPLKLSHLRSPTSICQSLACARMIDRFSPLQYRWTEVYALSRDPPDFGWAHQPSVQFLAGQRWCKLQRNHRWQKTCSKNRKQKTWKLNWTLQISKGVNYKTIVPFCVL